MRKYEKGEGRIFLQSQFLYNVSVTKFNSTPNSNTILSNEYERDKLFKDQTIAVIIYDPSSI